MVENETKKKVIAAAIIAGLAGVGIGGAVSYNMFPQVVENEMTIVQEVPVEVIKEIEVIKEVEVEVPVNVTVEVPVDNGNLDLVLNHIYDNDGKVKYLTEDLDDDEVSQIADRVVFVNEIKELAIREVKSEGVDELDKEVVGTETLDEDDIERFKVDVDHDDITVDDIDFEDKDADVFVTARFEQDDVDYEAVFKVEIKDGDVDDITVDSVNLK